MVELHRQMAEYDNFYECQLLAVRFDRQQTRLTLYLDCSVDGREPLDTETPPEPTAPAKVVELTFDPVQEVRFVNGLTPYQITHLDEIGWGLNEIGNVELRDDPALLAPYRGSPVEMHHAVFDIPR